MSEGGRGESDGEKDRERVNKKILEAITRREIGRIRWREDKQQEDERERG